MNYPDVKSIIDSVISDHIRYEYPKLVEFAKAYFDFLEQSNKAGFYQNNLPQQRDVELQEAQFAARIQKELGIVAPQEYAADPKIFFNKIKEIWNAKGSEESIKAFFRLYLNDEVDIFYPWESVLIPSDGRWLVKTVLRVTMIDGTPDQFVGQRIRQLNGDATAIVDAYETRIYSDSIIYELNLVKDSISDSFDPQSVIYVEGISGLRAEVYRTFSGFNIVNGGTGYSIGDKIVATGLDGYTFTSYVSVVDNTGKVADIKVTNFGAGNTPLHVRESNVSETYYFDDYVINSYDLPESTVVTGTTGWVNSGGQLQLTRATVSGLVDGQVGYVTLADVEIPLRILSITAAGSNSIYVFDYLASTAQLAELNAGYSINFTSQVSNPNPELTITSNGGTGLELTFNFTGQVNYPGFYEGVKGQLSEGIVLQDSFYYQKFSYEIKTTQSSDKWINALKRTIHPGGTEVFGNITLTELLDSTIKSSEMFVLRSDPNGYLFLENPGLKSSALLFGETPADAYVLITDHYFAEDYVGGASFRSVYSGLYTDSVASITETPSSISTSELI